MIKIKEINSTELVVTETTSNEKYHIEIAIDENDQPFFHYAKIINIKIINGDSPKWYADKIGEVFEAVEHRDYYSTLLGPGVISKDNAVILDVTITELYKEEKSMKEIIDRIRGSVEEEIKKVGFIDDSDSAGVQRFVDSLIYGLIEDTELEFDVVMDKAKEYLEES